MKAPKPRSPRAASPVRNDILRALLVSEYRHLSPKFKKKELKSGDVIYQAGRDIEYVYFPETAVVAMLDTMDNGGTIEVGVIGHEGMVGINIFLGCLTTPDKAIVQMSGSAMRMKTSDLRQELRFGSSLQGLLLRYTQALLSVISQSVGCSQHHEVSQRLARWLLTMHHYAQGDEFEMSQQFIADMLGVRRVGVTHAAGQFQAAGLIKYSRGRIRILDTAGLRKKSCECYRFIRRQYDGLLTDVPRFLPPTKSPALGWPRSAKS